MNSNKKPQKAYDNEEFMHSSDARVIRMLTEYLYPQQHFRKFGIKKLIIFFGSARSMSDVYWNQKLVRIENELSSAPLGEKGKSRRELKLHKLRKVITNDYEEAVELSRLITEWSLALPKKTRFHVCSGGGPGMMEAANKGANLAGGLSIGFNISLPFEQESNLYITPEHNFEFHYFFMRKFWFVYMGQALIVFPGGFGTLDELMEILTLRQTHKVTRQIPIILYSREFWNNVVNFQYLVDMGMISEEDLDLFSFADSPEEAFEIVKSQLINIHNIKQ
jgi:uncharacterized protein (TIGR00730 family)